MKKKRQNYNKRNDFFKKHIQIKQKNEENVLTNDDKKSTEIGLGEFVLNDFPEEERNKSFYFHEYNKPDGDWIEIDEPICKIRIGEMSEFTFKSASVMASESSILEHTLKKGDLISNCNVLYKLHQKGEYKNENTIDNFEFKSVF